MTTNPDELDFLLTERQHLDDRIRELRRTFEPLPEGDYEAVIDTVDRQQGENTGRLYWRIKFIVLSGAYRGRAVWMNIVEMLPDGLRQLQHATGVDLSYTVMWDKTPEAFEDFEVVITVSITSTSTSDHVYNEVRAVRPST